MGHFGCYTINAFVTVRAGEEQETGEGKMGLVLLLSRVQGGSGKQWEYCWQEGGGAYDGNVKTITDDDHQ